jgi:hypothetical protein
MPPIIAHRSLGIGEPGENVAANVPLALASGFGAEIDVRGDGAQPFELGHLAPNGDTLSDVFAGLRNGWRSSMSGQILILDIANDEGGVVSQHIVDKVYDEIVGTVLVELQIVITGANLEMLAKMRASQDAHTPKLDISFALTYWYAPEYSVPAWVDIVMANARELPTFEHPHPVLLFGVETRAAMREALTSHSEIIGVITDHPRRAANW